MAVPTLTSRTHRRAAKRRLAAVSVAPVAAGYERALRPCQARFSRPLSTTCSAGDR